jgi:hypothetical protein
MFIKALQSELWSIPALNLRSQEWGSYEFAIVGLKGACRCL